ncbi:MAG TPA: starvation-sensing protein RspA [Bacteroides sp.]|nr:starvation-sensing protein RspA [Bacteroides sp.]
MNQRRELLKAIALLPLAACTSKLENADGSLAHQMSPVPAGWNPPGGELRLQKVKIKKVRAITTAPYGTGLVIVKVETDQPGLYGVGCATFTQRIKPVVTAVNDYLDEFCRDKDASSIEDIWQTAYVSSYWRNGPVLNNALSGLDQALWDIKGKLAGMPVYQLLGGKTRFAVDTYSHASGDSPEKVLDHVASIKEKGFRNIRMQLGGYGSTHLGIDPDYKKHGFGAAKDNTMNTQAYKRGVVQMFRLARKRYGDDIELLHDMHERVEPMDAIDLIKKLEEYRPFFIEDPFSPENMRWFPMLREQCAVPIAMGELFNNPHEWVDPMANRWYDFIRIHISQIGGITPAMKVARLGEWFNVRTAWHGPGDTSPVGHAANAHIDLAVWNFGIQECKIFNDITHEVFPGTPTIENGYMFVNEAPGLGIDIDEEKAARFPLKDYNYQWTQVRKPDGTPVRP